MTDIDVLNKKAFRSEELVRYYASEKQLLVAEQLILDKFRAEWKNMRMLDIGVGGGRTAVHFAPLVKEYVGIDYSEEMINVCKKQFEDKKDTISFKVCDVRALTPFQDDYFDFIMFSFNGLDCIDHEDRLKALNEIRRVGKPEALFFFSAHNLGSIENLFKIRLSCDLIALMRALKYAIILRASNKTLKALKNMQYAVIKDGVHDSLRKSYHIKLYYIRPAEQIKQLEDSGFDNITLCGLNGK